jgi:hypothetical protein
VFVCVPLAEANFADRAAIYVIICVAADKTWTVLDVGQSGEVGSRIDAHDRGECWKRNCPSGNIWVCVHRMPTSTFTKEQRLARESAIRTATKPKCGSR